jgi:hypothetical protein
MIGPLPSFCWSSGDQATNNLWPLVDSESLFSVVHVLDPTVEDSDALLSVIGYVDLISKLKSFSVRIDGVAFCPIGRLV